jgi:hypothetical protein
MPRDTNGSDSSVSGYAVPSWDEFVASLPNSLTTQGGEVVRGEYTLFVPTPQNVDISGYPDFLENTPLVKSKKDTKPKSMSFKQRASKFF